ncbi:BON domain-containing protein [Streptomyces sp. CC208A]|uniref:BON domain-containing protein n=1 Tax=Streptomyces sp. CC208A TaxID=3044573 RepID=UPI0024A8B93C|nr:BON domain-containing protein [Streptomyces sp. CC208A]
MTERPERPEPYEDRPPGPAASSAPSSVLDSDTDEYRIARLRERLAEDGPAELGVQVERRGSAVLLTGTVPTADRRDEIVELAHATLTGFTVRTEIAVAGCDAPDHGEELP